MFGIHSTLIFTVKCPALHRTKCPGNKRPLPKGLTKSRKGLKGAEKDSMRNISIVFKAYLGNYWTHKSRSPIKICRISREKQLDYFQIVL